MTTQVPRYWAVGEGGAVVRCRAKVRCDDGRWPNRTLQADGRQTCVGAWHCLRRQGADASVPIRRRAMVSWVECCDTRAARRGRRKGSKFGQSGFPKAGAVAGKCGKVGCLALAFACLPCASSIVDGHAFRYKAPAFWRGYRPAFLLGADQDMNDGKLRPSSHSTGTCHFSCHASGLRENRDGFE